MKMEIFGSYPLNAANKNSKNRRGTRNHLERGNFYFEAVPYLKFFVLRVTLVIVCYNIYSMKLNSFHKIITEMYLF